MSEDKAVYDRFSSNEDIEYDSIAFEEGRDARNDRQPLSSNPHSERYLIKSWNAGWCDMDMEILTEGKQFK